jgi:sialidase-1
MVGNGCAKFIMNNKCPHNVRSAIAVLITCLIANVVTNGAEPMKTDVFVSGVGGYKTYRIPAIVADGKGVLLAFCEGRRNGQSDSGDIDLLLRRSTDGGKTWGDQQVIWDDGANTCGNPCPVLDRATGTIWLLSTWNSGVVNEGKIKSGFGTNSRRVFVLSSKDGGVSWAAPKEITAAVKLTNWSWYATGPGAGIQLERGAHAGRLVIPCDHKAPATNDLAYSSHVIFSDDHGATWKLGGTAPKDKVNECEVVELADARLMLNMRNYDRSLKARQVCFSDDGGETWKDQRHEPALIDPICQASIRRLRWPAVGKPGVVLFSNAASETNRAKLTVRASYDEGVTWPLARPLHERATAYSCLVALADSKFGCFYENGEQDSYERITFARLSLGWLETGNHVQSETAK